MANALLYTQSGGGKTVNSTLVAAPKRKKNLLICTDNSSIVLKNFDRKNLTVQNVGTVKDFDHMNKGAETFIYIVELDTPAPNGEKRHWIPYDRVLGLA